MLFAQMLRLPQPEFKPLAYSTLMVPALLPAPDLAPTPCLLSTVTAIDWFRPPCRSLDGTATQLAGTKKTLVL
jgi:hypothetical protein